MPATMTPAPTLRLDDLIVAEGPEGAESILVPGLDLTVGGGEAVAVVGNRSAAAALLEVLSGRRRARYGAISTSGAAVPPRTQRLATPVPADVRVVRPGQPTGRQDSAAVVVDATGGREEEIRQSVGELVESGCAVLVVADEASAETVRGSVGQIVPLDGRGPGPAPDVHVAEPELIASAAAALTGAGTEDERALLVARVLVDADVRGHFSHGVGLLPMYLDRVEQGGIDPLAEPEWISDQGPVAVLQGHGGFGQVAAELAARTCAARAKEQGVAAVAVRGNNHIGMLAAYRGHFTRHGVIGLIFNISGAGVAAPGAGRATLGNDALCMVVPRADAEPFVVDFATGTVASGKIRHAAHRGETVPDGWLVDRLGRATNDPNELDRGGAVPVFGGYKGLGVALVTEVLAGVLGGATVSPLVHKQRAEPERAMECSQLFLALDPAAFGSPPVDELLDTLSGAVAAGYLDGPPRIHLPEQQEQIATARADRDGIPVPASVADRLGWSHGTDEEAGKDR